MPNYQVVEPGMSAKLNCTTTTETAPSLTQTFYQRSAKPGESISLQCQSKGRPLPTFSWERDQELLLSDRRVRITSVHISNQVISVLNVTRVSAEDSGLYGCRATNEAGSVAHWARIGVHGKIFVHQGLSNVTAVPGEDVRIQCRYGGFPVDSVSWYKDDALLPRNVRHSLDNDGNLRIRDFMGSVDAGDYTCVVKSRDQEVRATTQLVLVVPPVIDDHFFPETITVDEGSRSRLLCSVSKGDGPLRFQWFKDGQLLSSVPDGSVQYSDDSAMIKFRKVRFRDRGKYTCFATNDAAGDNRTTDVVVNVSPRIKVAPQNSTTSVGGQVMLDCVAEGFPTPVVTWQKFGFITEVTNIKRALKARAAHYHRVPGVAAFSSSGCNTTDIREIIRDIVREEIKKLLPTAASPLPSIAEIVREEVQQALQPEVLFSTAPGPSTLSYAVVARRPPPHPRTYVAPTRCQSPAPQHNRRHEDPVQYACPELRAPRKTDV
ncbi:hypothetical protein HPB47_013612 [Ixodes persulcatus]|uniref:Uncharacterized protein n=1 Tax=Ixodes persulcatus TaxID=34615 RepID=A0AC60R1K0_IXOPE|nr:hypothetical protein HPB47_013612 [Ixodes persulcatus]